MPKNSYTKVKTGSIKAEILRMVLRDQGVTQFEFNKEFSHNNPNVFTSSIYALGDMNGFDIRRFPVDNSTRGNPHSNHKYISAYCCVGQYNWDGSYIDFTQEENKHVKETII